MAKKKTENKAVAKAVKKPAKKAVKNAVKKAAKKKSAALAQKPAPSFSLHPYLNFNGQCEAAFNLYRSVFGGKFTMISRFKEIPPAEGQPKLSDKEGEKIMHVSLLIGKDSVLMGSDTSKTFGYKTVVGNNFSISINTASKNEADKFFKGLSEGGKTTMPMASTFWGSYFGMLTDRYGINWMISFG